MTRSLREERAPDLGGIGAASTGIGTALVTIIAGSCCVSPVLAPIIVVLLGASGAVWAAGLKPYRGWMLAGSFACLAVGFWSVYRPRRDCAAGGEPKSRVLPRVARASLWIGAMCWTASLLITLIVP
jgi:hypothetical protein